VQDIPALVDTPDLLAVDDEMRAFVQQYTRGVPRGRSRLMVLHSAIRGAASLGIKYDPYAQGSAQDVFHSQSANCLSYANLFVALAREAGLKASYQWVQVRPQWTLRGERVLLRMHVNTLINPDRSNSFMVDIEPVPNQKIARAQTISDSAAQALHLNNVAMEALAEKDLERAWLHAYRALELSPSQSLLWVNIGAIYRAAGQLRAAEVSYLHALDIDSGNASAMNNLSVLYSLQGREAEQAYWDERVENYRESNPYYYSWLAEAAAEQDDWTLAVAHYEKALHLLPKDSGLLYAAGLAHLEIDQPLKASQYIERAIKHASLRTDIDTYQQRLELLRRELGPRG